VPQKVGNELVNVEFDKAGNVKDPVKAGMKNNCRDGRQAVIARLPPSSVFQRSCPRRAAAEDRPFSCENRRLPARG
jgi:hypothetical protein